MRRLTVTGAGGVRLSVTDCGDDAAASILFVHGWAQSSLSWRWQMGGALSGFRVVAVDLRGHGMSEAPSEASAYTDWTVWAEDIAAVIDQLDLRDVTLVGWSHGAFIVADYLNACGDDALVGVNVIGWALKMGTTPEQREFIDVGFEELHGALVSEDLETRIEATRAFVAGCTAQPLPTAQREEALCFNMAVSPNVRKWTALHDPCDYTDMISRLNVPLLVTHGLADTVVRPAAAEQIRLACPTASVSLYPGVGHSPFLESPARYNQELAEFVLAAHERKPASRK